MCLSTVDRNEMKKENVLCSDVTTIEQEGSTITLTDLFGRRLTVEGTPRRTDLTGGTVVLEIAE